MLSRMPSRHSRSPRRYLTEADGCCSEGGHPRPHAERPRSRDGQAFQSHLQRTPCPGLENQPLCNQLEGGWFPGVNHSAGSDRWSGRPGYYSRSARQRKGPRSRPERRSGGAAERRSGKGVHRRPQVKRGEGLRRRVCSVSVMHSEMSTPVSDRNARPGQSLASLGEFLQELTRRRSRRDAHAEPRRRRGRRAAPPPQRCVSAAPRELPNAQSSSNLMRGGGMR